MVQAGEQFGGKLVIETRVAKARRSNYGCLSQIPESGWFDIPARGVMPTG